MYDVDALSWGNLARRFGRTLGWRSVHREYVSFDNALRGAERLLIKGCAEITIRTHGLGAPGVTQQVWAFDNTGLRKVQG